jgi:hypothetical protein
MKRRHPSAGIDFCPIEYHDRFHSERRTSVDVMSKDHAMFMEKH